MMMSALPVVMTMAATMVDAVSWSVMAVTAVPVSKKEMIIP